MIKGLNILRGGFVVICGVLGWKLAEAIAGSPGSPGFVNVYGLITGAIIGGILIAAEVGFTRRYLGVVTSALFGLLGGLILTVLFIKLLFLLPIFEEASEGTKIMIQVASIVLFSYLGLILTLQSRENFKFVIPFVELQKEGKTRDEILLDSNILIDGRIVDVLDTGLINRKMIIPRFVLNELQTLSDSENNMKRARGRRGLEILEELRNNPEIETEIIAVKIPYEEKVDDKLIQFAKTENMDVLSNDYNLSKIGSVEGVKVINLNEVARALKPRAIPGETLKLEIVKEGEEEEQGIGYLDDGTMVVVEGGQHYIDDEIAVSVTSTIQTNAGRMIFAEPAEQTKVSR